MSGDGEFHDVMKFAAPQFIYALPVVLAFAAWAFWRKALRRRQLLQRFAGGKIESWMETGASRNRERVDEFLLVMMTIGFLVTLARPMYFAKDDRSELQGAPYLIALDASRSMLATDVEPSRYGAAAIALDRFFAETRSDHVGLITFAGVAYLNSPFTFDMTALRTILSYVDPNALVDPGSSITSALDRAGRFFRSNSIPERTLILISDGEDLDATAAVDMARRLRREGVAIHTIGVGTPAGATIPAWRGGAYATNMNGREIVSKLDEPNLRRIANAGAGKYFRLGPSGEGLRRLREEVLNPLAEKMARNDLRNYHEAYYAPLILALLAALARLLFAANRFTHKPHPLPSIAEAMR
jgi:Ca-activated chloride channel family protein